MTKIVNVITIPGFVCKSFSTLSARAVVAFVAPVVERVVEAPDVVVVVVVGVVWVTFVDEVEPEDEDEGVVERDDVVADVDEDDVMGGQGRVTGCRYSFKSLTHSVLAILRYTGVDW